jgi:DUF4097 and DUF4098 domain-containing protein YvlB
MTSWVLFQRLLKKKNRKRSFEREVKMITKRFVALLTILTVLFFFLGMNPLGAFEDQKYEEKFEKTESIARDGKVEVRNVSGDVDVKTWDRAEVKIDALKVSKASTMEKAKEYAEKVKIEVYEEDGILKIETKYPKPSIKGLNVSVTYSVMVPSQASIKAKTVSGDVTVENIGGKAEASTVSGNVDIMKAEQGANGESVSGNVTVMDVNNGLYCKTVSGDVKARNISGNTELKSVSGNVIAENIRGDVEAETVSGNVKMLDISGADVVKGKALSGAVIYDGEISQAGRYSLDAHSGRVEMRIPSGSAFDFEASTFSGSIDTEFEIVISGKMSKKKISGSVNGGGADVNLKSFSGDIYLKKR